LYGSTDKTFARHRAEIGQILELGISGRRTAPIPKNLFKKRKSCLFPPTRRDTIPFREKKKRRGLRKALTKKQRRGIPRGISWEEERMTLALARRNY
jgi:hypothetical protein